MLPSISFGPLSLPTGPFVSFIAAALGLEIAGRYGKRLGLAIDDVWNCGLLALIAGLLVARIWNVLQFWDIYSTEPTLLLSFRPGGFVLLPGVLAALIAGYLYLLRRALDPVRMGAAFALGGLATALLLNIGDFLTGAMLGLPSRWPWALPYYGEMRHPVALYHAVGLLVLLLWLWWRTPVERPGRTILLAALGYSLLRVGFDGFVDEATLWGSFRASQVVALGAALCLVLWLARNERVSRE